MVGCPGVGIVFTGQAISSVAGYAVNAPKRGRYPVG